jgi:hypothetical protein
MEREDQQRQAEQEQFNAQLKAQQEAREDEQAFEAEENQKDRDNDLKIATIRALGGMQTDNNANSQPDAMENLNAFFKTQELSQKRQAAKDTIAAKRQTDTDKMMVDLVKANKDVEKEKIKGEYNLKVAKENKTNKELQNKKKKK